MISNYMEQGFENPGYNAEAEQEVKEIVRGFLTTEEGESRAVEFLRANKDLCSEFCLQVFESFQEGDNTGLIRIGMLLKKLL